MKKSRMLGALIVLSVLTFAFVRSGSAQNAENMKTFFSKNYAGISIRVNATAETVPGADVPVSVWVNCTAEGVYVDYMNLSVYGYRSGQEKVSMLTEEVMSNASLVFNHTSLFNYTVSVPGDVWDATYGELFFKYAIMDLVSPDYSVGFSMTLVRNTYLENLQQQLANLTEGYGRLNGTYWQLNGTYEALNESYWQLQQNYTALRGSITDLDNTRRAVFALGITTVFFVATTAYLVLRKPKQYW